MSVRDFVRGAAYVPLTVIDPVTERETNWPMGTVVQEIHTGSCCPDEQFCDFYEQLWVMAFQCGWTRAGSYYDHNDDVPRLPVRLLWHPDWALEAVNG